jgi:hypothetical protein
MVKVAIFMMSEAGQLMKAFLIKKTETSGVRVLNRVIPVSPHGPGD